MVNAIINSRSIYIHLDKKALPIEPLYNWVSLKYLFAASVHKENEL
jgi:hypothetical protein